MIGMCALIIKILKPFNLEFLNKLNNIKLKLNFLNNFKLIKSYTW